MVCSHVDDLIWTGDNKMDELMSRVQQRFTFGSMDSGNFRFCETKPAHVDRERMRQPTDHASSQEQSQMRAVLGSIGWVARPGRPELSYVCFALQGKQSSPTVVGLKATNKLLSAAQKTSKNGIRFVKGKFNFEEAVLLSVTDASHAAELIVDENGNKQGHKSQGGRFLLLADHMPQLDHETWCQKRVCRSTLQAEVLSSMHGSEEAERIRMILYSLRQPKVLGSRYSASC